MEGNAGRKTPGMLGLTFVVGTVLGLLVVVLWVTVVDRGGEGAGTATQVSSTSTAGQSERQGAAQPEPPQAPADTRAERCADAARALEAPLEAARPALRQWDVHVQAMNKLVVGEITLAQATRFWDQTRVGAQRNVAGFRTAWSELERTGVDCPAAGLMGPAPDAVRSCSRLVQAEMGVLRTARTSIDTWDVHVQHMDMLRMGTMSPEEATEMWLTMWRRGVRDLGAYRTATQDPALGLACPQAESSE